MAQVQVNLMTKEFKETDYSFINAILRWVVIFAVIGIVVIGALQFVHLYALNGDIADKTAELENTKKKAAEVIKLTEMQKGIQSGKTAIANLKASAVEVGAILDTIQRRTPPNVTIISHAVKPGGVDLNVSALVFEDVRTMVDSLRAETFAGDKKPSIVESVELQSLVYTIPRNDIKPVQAMISVKFKGGKR